MGACGGITGGVKRALALLLIATLLTTGIASVVGLHLHVLPDGRLVVHSHPVSNRSSQHHHSSHEFALLDAATHHLFYGDLPMVAAAPSPVSALLYVLQPSHGAFRAPLDVITFADRAPPILSLV